jgi:hypothetical protein
MALVDTNFYGVVNVTRACESKGRLHSPDIVGGRSPGPPDFLQAGPLALIDSD